MSRPAIWSIGQCPPVRTVSAHATNHTPAATTATTRVAASIAGEDADREWQHAHQQRELDGVAAGIGRELAHVGAERGSGSVHNPAQDQVGEATADDGGRPRDGHDATPQRREADSNCQRNDHDRLAEAVQPSRPPAVCAFASFEPVEVERLVDLEEPAVGDDRKQSAYGDESEHDVDRAASG